jgi:hypothetical protein
MKLSDIKAPSNGMVSVASDEVDQFEASNWVTFPTGYRDYITKLGEGVLGDFVRMYPPRRIEKELHEWRKRIDKYWFWEESEKLLPKNRALECLIIGDTVNGDEIIFHPARPNKLFVLPGDLESAAEIGDNLETAIGWILTSGELTEPVDTFDFEPFDSRLEETESGAAKKPLDPEGESIDDIIKLGKEWAKRHSMKKKMKKYYEEHVKQDYMRYFKRGIKLEILCEAVAVNAKGFVNEGFMIVADIQDEPSKLSLARMTWQSSEFSQGAAIEPNLRNQEKIEEMETDPN